MYKYRYVAGCDVIGGTAQPLLDDCLHFWEEDPDDCNAFLDEDCKYTAEEVLSSDIITDKHSCQEYLQGLSVLGANYFVYNITDHTCTLYATAERACTSSMGPKYPDMSSCTGSTQSPTTTTAGPECVMPEDIVNGSWGCLSEESGDMACYLTCDDGYASSQFMTSCPGDNTWQPQPQSFVCSPAVIGLFGGVIGLSDNSFEVFSTDSPGGVCRGVSDLSATRTLGAAELMEDKVIYCGGIGENVEEQDDCVSLDLETLAWQHHSYMLNTKTQPASVRIKSSLLMVGGIGSNGIEQTVADNDQFWEYGVTFPDGIRELYGHCSLRWTWDSLIIIGGIQKRSSTETSETVYMLNTTSSEWTRLPSLLQARNSHSCGLINGKLVVAGGLDGTNSQVPSSTEILDSLDGEFRAVGNLVTPRDHAVMGVIDGGRLVIIGGSDPESNTALDSVEEFDMSGETWSLREERLSVQRLGHSSAIIPNTVCQQEKDLK